MPKGKSNNTYLIITLPCRSLLGTTGHPPSKVQLPSLPKFPFKLDVNDQRQETSYVGPYQAIGTGRDRQKLEPWLQVAR